MSSRTKIIFKRWLISAATWILILYFYGLLTVYGFKAYFDQNPITGYIYSEFFHLELILTGLILGTLFAVINHLTDVPALRKKSFGFIIFTKSMLYILSLLLCTLIIYHVFYWLRIVSAEQFVYYKKYLFDVRYMASVIAYFFFFIFLTNFVVQINKKFGPGELFNLLRGKYYHPHQEQLFILFIDLKSSTTIAESLGHKKYSQFLRECVHELTPILERFQARVYQYVGDEIVLYWNIRDRPNPIACLDTFFGYQKVLSVRKQYFQEKYGFRPEFKAGMDAGEVTVTEIGELKREIAFHGDVMNTAARLEKKCNELEKWLLVTENVVGKIPPDSNYSLQFLNDLPLRGRHERLRYYAATPPQ